jgi:serine/threonine-protein kinase
VDAANDTLVGDRYRLERPLGEGGMGAVWAATDLVTGGRVAVKFLRDVWAANPEMQRRFLREARAAMAIDHPNVVYVHEIVRADDGSPIIVMDALDGESLADRLERGPTISLPEFSAMFLQVISAVASAHAAGVVHRDLKPANIFLTRTPTGTRVHVLDFGIAKLAPGLGDSPPSARTESGVILGTPQYMAPEQIFGERDVDYRADVWSLGVIMFECLAGRRPVDGENLGRILKVLTSGQMTTLSHVAGWLPKDVLAIHARMLRVDRKERLNDLRAVYGLLLKHASAEAQAFGEATTQELPLPTLGTSIFDEDDEVWDPHGRIVAPASTTRRATAAMPPKLTPDPVPSRPRSEIPVRAIAVGVLLASSLAAAVIVVVRWPGESTQRPAASTSVAKSPTEPTSSSEDAAPHVSASLDAALLVPAPSSTPSAALSSHGQHPKKPDADKQGIVNSGI